MNAQTVEPTNTPASLIQKNDSIFLKYDNVLIFKAKIISNQSAVRITKNSTSTNGRTELSVAVGTDDFKPFTIIGAVNGSPEAFACESEPKDGLKIVRHVVGQSKSLRNNAVYDRNYDWLLSFDNFYPNIVVQPGGQVGAPAFNITIKGWEIVIRFRPRFYNKHRGLEYFEPWKYNIWKKPVVGWCSWYAYFDKIDEEKIKTVTDVVSAKLQPYGLEYIQMDDGFQQTPIGLPDTWITANKKFPSGLPSLSKYISYKGLKPAIWTNVAFADSAAAYQNKSLFVTDKKGNPAKGNWVGYVMDGSNAKAMQELIEPIYKNYKDNGWKYFKLDALRHLRYEGYNSFADYFNDKKATRAEAFRNVVKSVRKAIGNENFLMACWGIRPELTGIVDACRIGNDGYSYAGLAQFNSYNNVVWLNDPDHIELSETEAYRSCVATSLTGSLFMVTDKPEVYSTNLIEAAKRSIPPLHTVPGQVYDVDPSRSSMIQNVELELSGSGPRIFDASTTTTTGLFSLEINKPFEAWTVLGRLDERDETISLKDLGLDDKKEYLVFEFWTKKFMGIVNGNFIPGKIDPLYKCQVFVFREKQEHPQLLATNRHISGGGLELNNVLWGKSNLSGESEIVAGDPYTLYLYETEKFIAKDFTANDVTIVENKKSGLIRQITMLSATSKKVSWNLNY
jgi:alpha-galactosidase